MIKGIIDSYELWQNGPENLNENMEDPIESAENRGWNQCNRSWIKTIEEQPRVGEWIPCSEDMPKEHGSYLCQITDKYHTWFDVFKYHDDLYAVDDYDFSEYKGKNVGGFYGYNSEYGYFHADYVTAWMPLPTAFKGE